MKVTRKLKTGDVLDIDGVRYVVYQTAFNGGGTGHGPHDVYPDGYHVYAEALEDTAKRIDFWQTGCFTRIREIGSVDVVGFAQRRWVTAIGSVQE